MEIIKFRGKALETEEYNNIKENDWVYGYYFEIEGEHYIIPYGLKNDFADILFGEFIEIKPESLGQFTGLKDKNGKEIFGKIEQIEVIDKGEGK